MVPRAVRYFKLLRDLSERISFTKLLISPPVLDLSTNVCSTLNFLADPYLLVIENWTCSGHFMSAFQSRLQARIQDFEMGGEFL